MVHSYRTKIMIHTVDRRFVGHNTLVLFFANIFERYRCERINYADLSNEVSDKIAKNDSHSRS